MKITMEMVHELNRILANDGCAFRYKMIGGTAGNPNIQIVPCNMKYLNSYILNINTEFRQFITDFFHSKGIKLAFNNDCSIMWSVDGYGIDP